MQSEINDFVTKSKSQNFFLIIDCFCFLSQFLLQSEECVHYVSKQGKHHHVCNQSENVSVLEERNQLMNFDCVSIIDDFSFTHSTSWYLLK